MSNFEYFCCFLLAGALEKIKTNTVFPRIVSAETILFWIWPVLWTLVWKLFKGGNYLRAEIIRRNTVSKWFQKIRFNKNSGLLFRMARILPRHEQYEELRSQYQYGAKTIVERANRMKNLEFRLYFCLFWFLGANILLLLSLEIVINELWKLRMSADFFANSSHIILGVQECKVFSAVVCTVCLLATLLKKSKQVGNTMFCFCTHMLD